jgi:DNA-binding NtrC family response regulator
LRWGENTYSLEDFGVNSEKAVLHIDDDPQVSRLVAARLQSHGYQVTSLTDPRTALRELMQNQWRVVLLDIDMPSISGIDLLREIKAYDGGIQVIMLTGIVSMNALLQSFRFGAEACLFKPLSDYAPLLDALEDTFRKIDRWWDALEELSQRRCEEQTVTIS